MQMISGSKRRRKIGLRGLPAVIVAVTFVVTATAFMLIVSLFGAVIWGIRRSLGSLLAFFGAPEPETAEEIPMMHGRRTIEMRRDESGSWRRD